MPAVARCAILALAAAGALFAFSSPASAMTEAQCKALGGFVDYDSQGQAFCVTKGTTLVASGPSSPHGVESCLARGKFLIARRGASLACVEKFVSGEDTARGGARR
jgi:hypothetical protein